jgi:cell wall-associated NlpC family hydrolase
MSCAISVCLLSLSATPASAEDVVELAARMIGRPYVWGAEGPGSFDCSGLTHYVYGKTGIELPRRAIDQSRVGDVTRRLQRGDLLFFASDQRRSLVTHVGIYEGDGIMIDASQRHGRVRRDDLDEPFWAERFMFARRITDTGTRPVHVPTERTSPRTPDRAKVAARVLGHIAEVLLRRR